jgi:hypothetical protein
MNSKINDDLGTRKHVVVKANDELNFGCNKNYSSIPPIKQIAQVPKKKWSLSAFPLQKCWTRQSSLSLQVQSEKEEGGGEEEEVDERPTKECESSSKLSSSSVLAYLLQQPAPRQILILMLLLALAFGSIVGVVPAVVTDRYARLNHGYQNSIPCWKATLSSTLVPPECLAASGDAQNVAAWENFLSNAFTFITSSMVGSISDERGRRGTDDFKILCKNIQNFTHTNQLLQVSSFSV